MNKSEKLESIKWVFKMCHFKVFYNELMSSGSHVKQKIKNKNKNDLCQKKNIISLLFNNIIIT